MVVVTGNQMQIRILHVFSLQRKRFNSVHRIVSIISSSDRFIGYFGKLSHELFRKQECLLIETAACSVGYKTVISQCTRTISYIVITRVLGFEA